MEFSIQKRVWAKFGQDLGKGLFKVYAGFKRRFRQDLTRVWVEFGQGLSKGSGKGSGKGLGKVFNRWMIFYRSSLSRLINFWPFIFFELGRIELRLDFSSLLRDNPDIHRYLSVCDRHPLPIGKPTLGNIGKIQM